MMKDLENIKFDLCVIGAGPAGIIMSLEYARLNLEKTVLLIEFGTSKHSGLNELDEAIVVNNLENHHDPYECTNKGFGGSSQTWGGRCVMYDEIDFIDREIVGSDCTWDIELYNEIKNYTFKTSEYFECGNDNFDINTITVEKKRIVPNFKEEDITDSTLERWSMPTRFGKRYREEIECSKNIKLIEGYVVEKLIIDKSKKEITSIVARDKNDQFIKINACNFVISAGAQESTRLLLNNNHIFTTIPRSLGRYYQGHISGKIASVKFYSAPSETDFGFQKDGCVYVRRRFQFSKDFLVNYNLLNTAIWLDNPLYFDPSHKSGAMSFMYLAMITPVLGKWLAPPAIAHSVTKGKVYKVLAHILNIIKDFPKSILIPLITFYKRYLIKRKLPGIFLYSPENIYALHFHSEQIPNEESKMVMQDGKLIIDYKITDEDIESVIKLHEKLDKELRKNNCGELLYWYPKEVLKREIKAMTKDGIHQCGTTRIAKSIDSGVVDRNLCVFGLENLFVCSSSVFPTSGQANPTFLLGAFAIRLANYLTKK